VAGDDDQVLAAAHARAAALVAGDPAALRSLLHPDFGWVSHRGEAFDRGRYVAANTAPGGVRWRAQILEQAQVHVVGDAAVLRCTVTDVVTGADGREVGARMWMTQTWTRDETTGWVCLAGHAGPRLD
jgi:ketosteroid isomerase-like protein